MSKTPACSNVTCLISFFQNFWKKKNVCLNRELDTQRSWVLIFTLYLVLRDNANRSDLSSHWRLLAVYSDNFWQLSCLENNFHTSKGLDHPLLKDEWPRNDCAEPSFWNERTSDGALLLSYLEKITGLCDYAHLSCKTIGRSLSHFWNVDKVSQLDIPAGTEGDLRLPKYMFSVIHQYCKIWIMYCQTTVTSQNCNLNNSLISII